MSRQRRHLLAMLTALHDATDHVRAAAPVEDFSIRGRPSLSAALVGDHPGDGPYATASVELLRTHRKHIEAALDRHDTLAAVVGKHQRRGSLPTANPRPTTR